MGCHRFLNMHVMNDAKRDERNKRKREEGEGGIGYFKSAFAFSMEKW